MPTFNDSENIAKFVPEGDYTFTVTEFDQAISQGGKTSGSTRYALTLEVDLPSGSRGPRVFESLIDHASTAWKIDTFLKSAGVALAKGEGFEFNEGDARKHRAKFVNPIGLRGWCRLVVEEYPANSGKKKNRVSTFYTNKAKLPALVAAPQATVIDAEDVPFASAPY